MAFADTTRARSQSSTPEDALLSLRFQFALITSSLSSISTSTMAADGSSNYSSPLFLNSSINDYSSSGTPPTSCLRPSYIAACVIIGVSCLLGVPANIAVIVKLGRHLRGSSISQRLFFNLAVSDLLCLLCLPVGVEIFCNGPRLSHEACQLLFYSFFFCNTSGLNILVLISIQRYYQVCY